jgi:hypothetical protein
LGHRWVGPDQDALELRLAPEGAEFMQLEEVAVGFGEGFESWQWRNKKV